MYCKICRKANELNRESQGRNIQNTALGCHAGIQEHQMANLCLHDKTYNTNSGDIFLIKIRWTKTEELI